MSRVVIVLGVGRSGTSVVGGILHNLGVDMGQEFVQSSPSNKYGTFEDREFFHFNRSYMDGKLDLSINPHEWSENYVARRNERSNIWGVKEPAIAAMLPIFLAYLGNDVRVIVASRDKLSTIHSYMFAYHAREVTAYKWYENAQQSVDNFLDDWQGPTLQVFYDDLIDESTRETWVKRISDFAFDGMEKPKEVRFWNAFNHVVESGQKFGRDGKWIKRPSVYGGDGWGRVAIGARVAKYPEYHFFTSWTQLLTGGVRKGDKVLMPVGWTPAHWASTALARDFMRTDLDSLLLVDDDMAFDQNALEALRSSVANWDYDIVSGFCTHRQWPPKPVVMREQEEQPELPRSLNGRAYGFVGEFSDGDIIDVDAVGLAFILIKRHVLEEMTGEYGPMYTHYFTYGTGYESDDVPFCQRAKDLGFKIGVDTSVKIGHVGQAVFGWNEYQMWQKQQTAPNVVDFNAADLVPILEEALPHLESHKDAARNVLGIIGGTYESGD